MHCTSLTWSCNSKDCACVVDLIKLCEKKQGDTLHDNYLAALGGMISSPFPPPLYNELIATIRKRFRLLQNIMFGNSLSLFLYAPPLPLPPLLPSSSRLPFHIASTHSPDSPTYSESGTPTDPSNDEDELLKYVSDLIQVVETCLGEHNGMQSSDIKDAVKDLTTTYDGTLCTLPQPSAVLVQCVPP